jgi:hypothetical protein
MWWVGGLGSFPYTSILAGPAQEPSACQERDILVHMINMNQGFVKEGYII